MEQAHKLAGQAICDAWVNSDFGLLRSVLANDLDWHEGSYDEPITTADAVVARWQNDLSDQATIQVMVEVLDVVGIHSYQHCVASWTDTKRGQVKIDGIFQVGLDNQGKIIQFRQWWNTL